MLYTLNDTNTGDSLPPSNYPLYEYFFVQLRWTIHNFAFQDENNDLMAKSITTIVGVQSYFQPLSNAKLWVLATMMLVTDSLRKITTRNIEKQTSLIVINTTNVNPIPQENEWIYAVNGVPQPQLSTIEGLWLKLYPFHFFASIFISTTNHTIQPMVQPCGSGTPLYAAYTLGVHLSYFLPFLSVQKRQKVT